MPASFDNIRQQTPEDCAHPYAADIGRAWDLYEGRHPQPLRVQPGDPDDNTIVNLARPIVDKGLSFLFGKELTWQIDETADADTAAEQYLRDVWADNDKMALLHEVGQNGFNAGLAAIKVNPQSDGGVHLVNLDPATLTLAWTRGNVDDICGYAITFYEEEGDRRTYYRQEITRDGGRGSMWTMADYVADAGEAWKLAGEPVPWPFPIAPIVHCKNLPRANCAWGYGDIASGKLNHSLNVITSAAQKTLRIHATPQTIGEGVKAAQLKRNAAGMWEIESGSKIYNLEMQSDLGSSHQFYQILRAAIYAGQRTPDLSSFQGNLGALTNFGLRVLFADLLDLTDTKRVLYGGMIGRLNALLCMIGRQGAKVTTKLTWADPLPVNTLEKATEIETKKRTGLISDETLTAEYGQGYSYADEQKRLAQQRAAQPQPLATPNGSTLTPATMPPSMPAPMHQEQQP